MVSKDARSHNSAARDLNVAVSMDADAYGDGAEPTRYGLGDLTRMLASRAYIMLALVGVGVIGALMSPYFLTGDNVNNIVLTGAVISVLAVGQFVVIVTAGIDLSVGAVTALATVVAAKLLLAGWHVPTTILTTLAFCGTFGMLNGLLVVFGRITPFVATLGMLSVAQGVAFLIQNGMLIVIHNEAFKDLLNGTVLGVSSQVITFIVVTVIFTLVMRWTIFGRQLYAIGGNAEAARLSGIPVTRSLIAAYAISGLLAGLAGLMLAAQLGQGSSLMARGAELDSIAAAVVGGASLFGGVGTPAAAVLGGLLIGAISNILDLRGIAAEPQLIMKGLLILLAVFLTSGKGTEFRARIQSVFQPNKMALASAEGASGISSQEPDESAR
jgi:ribose transport system permease protein